MKKFVLLLALAFPFAACSQTPYINIRTSLGYLATVFTGIFPTDSCLYLKGVMTDSLGRAGSFFSKVDLSGNFIKTTELVDSTIDYDSWWPKLIPTPGGNFLLTGYRVQAGDMACFIAEITPNGEVYQIKHFRSPYYPSDVFIVPLAHKYSSDGLFFVTGNIRHPTGYSHGFLAKMNKNLEIKWIKIMVANAPLLYQGLYSLLLKENGDVILGGWTHSRLGDLNTHCRKWVTEVDSTGENTVWSWQNPPSGLPPVRGWKVNDLIELPDGSIIGASAVCKEYPINSVSSILRSYPSMFKLSPDHTLAWETWLGNGRFSSDDREVLRIASANDGQGYVGAGSINILDTLTDFLPIRLGFMGKVAENGDSLWMRYIYHLEPLQNDRFHRVYDMAPAPGGGYWVCGEVTEQVPDNPLQQGWLLYVDDYGCISPGCQLIGTTETPLGEKLSIYPNPASDYLILHHAGYDFSKGRFFIVSAQGQVLRDWASPVDDLSTVINLQTFPAGVYQLQYTETSGTSITKAFVVAN